MEKDKKKRITNGKQGKQNASNQEHGLKNLRTIHRLDRLTSGLLMFGRCQLHLTSALTFLFILITSLQGVFKIFSTKLKKKKTCSANGELFYLYLFFKK